MDFGVTKVDCMFQDLVVFCDFMSVARKCVIRISNTSGNNESQQTKISLSS